MASPNTSIPLANVIWFVFLILFGSVQPCLSFSGNSSKSGSCIERERKALLSIQMGIYDAHKWLSWNGKDCCRWKGVRCHTMTGHVIKLDLHYPCDPGYLCYPDKSEISPSLLDLRHLNYLDLSINNFDGAPIPEFIGSLANLEYLNLSNARFGGTIPHQLGNLSNLLYLDLNSNFDYLNFWSWVIDQPTLKPPYYLLDVDNLGWLARIRSLQHLDMSNVNLSKASNWIHAINMLPSLSVMNLSGASLSILPSTLPHVNFTSLVTLDLSANNFLSSIPRWMLNLSSLEHLELGGNHFQGHIPLAIGNLKKLQVLDLSHNNFDGHIPETVWSLKSLQSLDLSENKIKGIISETVKNLKSLKSLDLSRNSISGGIPLNIGNLKKLQVLDLSSNSFDGHILETVWSLKSLQSLDLSENNIKGSISETVENLKSLKSLMLRRNRISGGIPETLGNLKSLESLDLSLNSISGEIPETIGNLSELKVLDLSNNIINGQIPRTVANLCNLSYFDASENNIGGEITGLMEGFSRCSTKRLDSIDLHDTNLSGLLPGQIGELRSLVYLDLGVNSLNGSIPASLGKLSNLSVLILASNSLVGALTEAHFANLTSLSVLDLSHNSLTVNVSQDWLPPYKAVEIVMTSCSLGPKFPSWLRNQTDLYILDLSSAGISENFPDWFWDMGLPTMVLDVSHNHMKGKLPTAVKIKKIRPSYLVVIRDSGGYEIFGDETTTELETILNLSNNLFSGPIPPTLAGGFPYLSILLLARNRINGSIPSAFCEAKHLQVLSLANNDLSGVLPDCWNNSFDLRVIDFSDNKLSGGIPGSMGSLSNLTSLHLRNNSLSGKIPPSLQLCKQLITIDLGNNKLSGGIPEWIGESLSSLRGLRLRSNMLDGNIPVQLSSLASLQVLDLANNKLFGTLPPSFGNFRAMIMIQHENKPILYGTEAFYYTENLLIAMKSLELTFTNGLPLVTSIDLSDNNISGEIPEEFTNLHGLHFVNLSRNYLTGRIPKDIGSMGQLESLDLSMNNLSSTIPTSISNLNFLEHLNLSHNNLSGRIPSGTQLQTFNDPSIYIGNQYLCGQPLPKKCPGDEPAGGPTARGRQEKQDENENDSEMIWFYTSLSPGFVVGFWGFLGAVMLKKSTRYAYIQFIDRICDWIYMAIIINSARLKFKRKKDARK